MFFLSWIGSNIYLLKAELSQRINSSLDGPNQLDHTLAMAYCLVPKSSRDSSKTY